MSHIFAFTAGCYFGLFIFALMSLAKRSDSRDHTDESLADIASKPIVSDETDNSRRPCSNRQNHAGISQNPSGASNGIRIYQHRPSTIGSDGKWELPRLERKDR